MPHQLRFDAWVEHGTRFVSEVAKELDRHPVSAFRILRGTLHALRDRLTPREAKNFVAQLPMLLKAVWMDGWDPEAGVDTKLRTVDDLVYRVMDDPAVTRGDYESFTQLQDHIAGVFRVIRRHVSQGEVSDVAARLPREIQALWRAAE